MRRIAPKGPPRPAPTRSPAPTTGRATRYAVNDGDWVTRPRSQGRASAAVSPLVKRPPSPLIGSIALAKSEDMVEVDRIQNQHGLDPDDAGAPPASGWLLGMPSLAELQGSADCEQHVWVAKDSEDPDRVIGSFAVSAPFTMSRPLQNHKFVVPLPPSIDAALRGFGVRYVSRVMVDGDDRYARTGVMSTMFAEVLNSDIYADTPCLAHVAIDPPNEASDGFFRSQGWKLIGYTANHADPALNTGLPASDSPVIGGLWLLPPAGVFVPGVEGSSQEVVARHPVEPGESFERFVPRRRSTKPPQWSQTIGGFFEYHSMLREARTFARNGRDALAQRPVQAGEVVFRRQPEVDAD